MRTGRPIEKTTLREKFYKFVRKHKGKDSCWEWTGSFFLIQGYGRLYHNSTHECKAHRISYIIHIGKIPKGKLVCHTCNNRWCVNPDHLYAGTNLDNMKDLADSGILKGINNRASKLTDMKVLYIRKIYSEGQITTWELAEKMKVSQCLICKVIRGEAWSHIGGPISPKKVKYKRVTSAEIERIIRWINCGWTIWEIATKLNRDEHTIGRILDKLPIKIR